jgi:hypothetical protein
MVAIYQLLTQGGSVVGTSPQTPLVQPYSDPVPPSSITFQASVEGELGDTAAVQLYGSNDGVNFSPIGTPLEPSMGMPAAFFTTQLWAYYGAALTALTDGASASVTMSY